MERLSLGKIVFYQLTKVDAEKINRRRVANATRTDNWVPGSVAHVGNKVHARDVLPMIITLVDDDRQVVNGQVFLDGNDTYWVTACKQADEPGGWQWSAGQ